MITWLFISAVLIFLFVFDEVFLDLIALFKRLRPRPIDYNSISNCSNKKRLAIIVANWREYEVLESMVSANSQLLGDSRVDLFLGVYPNDLETLKVAENIARKVGGIHVVRNRINGPTDKGQMLNEILNYIFNVTEVVKNYEYDGFVIHDAEDLISPQSIHLYRNGLIDKDFIQVPVISLPLSLKNLVGGVYLDEFAETHSKDLLLRESLGVAVPSAGVGTCLSRSLVLDFCNSQEGRLFKERNLTEDYILGMEAARRGYKTSFSCHYSHSDPDRILTATREYFPNRFSASVKQKTRWFTGICLQGWQKLGWFGSLKQRYYLWRDRKTLFASFLNLNCFLLLLVMPFVPLNSQVTEGTLGILLLANIFLLIFKVAIRCFWTYRHYGIRQSLMTPIRYPIGMAINTLAGFSSLFIFTKASIMNESLAWAKTSHQFPQLKNIEFLNNHSQPTSENKEVSL